MNPGVEFGGERKEVLARGNEPDDGLWQLLLVPHEARNLVLRERLMLERKPSFGT